MTASLGRILESKRVLRRELAARPLAEKLRILDQLRERDETIRTAAIGRHGVKGSENVPK